MENGEDGQCVPKEKIVKVFIEFMTRIAKLDELMTAGSRFLAGFRQALGFLGRPSLEKSPLLDRIMEAHGTKRFQAYVEAGCKNSYDSGKNVSQLHTCHLGLTDNINAAKIVLTELKCLLDDAIPIVQSIKEQHENVNHQLDCSIDSSDNEDLSLPSNPSKPEVADYAAMMAIIYSMVKQDYTMQDKIVSSLSLKSSQEELETYCLMWTLRPYIDDDLLHQAWSRIR